MGSCIASATIAHTPCQFVLWNSKRFAWNRRRFVIICPCTWCMCTTVSNCIAVDQTLWTNHRRHFDNNQSCRDRKFSCQLLVALNISHTHIGPMWNSTDIPIGNCASYTVCRNAVCARRVCSTFVRWDCMQERVHQFALGLDRRWTGQFVPSACKSISYTFVVVRSAHVRIWWNLVSRHCTMHPNCISSLSTQPSDLTAALCHVHALDSCHLSVRNSQNADSTSMMARLMLQFDIRAQCYQNHAKILFSIGKKYQVTAALTHSWTFRTHLVY